MKTTTIKTNASFVYIIEAEAVKSKLNARAERINAGLKVLSDFGELSTLEELKTYCQWGCDYRRQVAIAECQAYIQSTKMPKYLQEDALKRAYDSVDAEFLTELEDVLIGVELPDDLSALELEEATGKYHFSDAYVTAQIETKRKTLTDTEMEDFVKFRDILRLIGEIENSGNRFDPIQVILSYQPKEDFPDEKLAAALYAYRKPAQEVIRGRVLI